LHAYDDAELKALFRHEVTERSGRIAAGAGLMASGSAPEGTLGDLKREGHTIKGTARMMGFTEIGEAGRLIEEVVQAAIDGEAPAGVALWQALGRAAEALAGALDGESAELISACSGLDVVARGRGPRPEPPTTGSDGGATVHQISEAPAATADPAESGHLGGLLVALDSWAHGETVRVNAAELFRLINDICSLRIDVEAMGTLFGNLDHQDGEEGERLQGSIEVAGQLAGALQDRALELAAAPMDEVTSTFSQLVRYVARKAGKEVRFELVGDEIAVDRQVLEAVADPLRQLLVNAVRHGVETPEVRSAAGKPPTATVALRVAIEDNKLKLVVEDDGSGIDWEAIHQAARERGLLGADESPDTDRLRAVMFSPGFSTSSPDEIVGDGNGLASVTALIEQLHGSLNVETTAGRGTKIEMVVPTSRALQDVVLITAAGQMWGIPEIAVLDRIPTGAETNGFVEWRDTQTPVVSFAESVGLVEQEPPDRILVVSSPGGPVGFSVTEELGGRQVAARALGPLLDGVPHLTGAALLGAGDVVVIVDPGRLVERARGVRERPESQPRVLVVDDSRGARQVVGGALGSAGYEVALAASAAETLEIVGRTHFDGIVLDYVLPEMDGATLVQRIRDLGVEAPIVVLSGLATPQDQARAIAAGADAYFDKDDVRKGALGRVLGELIERRAAK
jgi:chemotaxis protein histidine kinase CheA